MDNEPIQHMKIEADTSGNDRRNEESAEKLGIELNSEPTEKILGKFNSTEDLEKGYKELEKKLGEQNGHARDEKVEETETGAINEPGEEGEITLPSDEEEPAEESSELPEEDSQDGSEDQVVEPTEVKAKVDQAFFALNEAGEMTEEVQELFTEVGISKELVQHYKELAEFKAQHQHQEFVSLVGSEEDYGKMLDWAAEKLSPEEADTFDDIIENGTEKEIRFAITNLKERMKASKPVRKDPRVVASSVSQKTGYTSHDAYMKDMKDPRYKEDSAFRQAVAEKLSRSNL